MSPIAFLDQRNQSQPFFIYLAYYTVHTPIQGCDQYNDYFEKKAKSLKGVATPIVEHDGLTHSRQDNAKLAAMTKSLDASVGRLLDALESRRLDENTVIVFTSDNGGLTTKHPVLLPSCHYGPGRDGATKEEFAYR